MGFVCFFSLFVSFFLSTTRRHETNRNATEREDERSGDTKGNETRRVCTKRNETQLNQSTNEAAVGHETTCNWTRSRKKEEMSLNPDPKLYLRMVLTVSVVHVSRRAINVSRLRPRGASKRHYPKISTTKIPPRFESTACLIYYDCMTLCHINLDNCLTLCRIISEHVLERHVLDTMFWNPSSVIMIASHMHCNKHNSNLHLP